jgi:hypothetical protein
MQTSLTRLALLMAAFAAIASPALAGTPGKWTIVGAANLDNIDEVGLARTGDGVLHAVFTVPSHNSGGGGDSLVHAAISPTGAVGGAGTIAGGWASISNVTDVIVTPDGGLRAFFGGIRTTNPGETNSNMNTATASASGQDWSLVPGSAVKGDSAYGSDTSAAGLPDGTPLIAFGGTGAGTFVHRGLDPGTPNFNLQDQFGQCCGYTPNVAVAQAGAPYVAWYSNASAHLGVFVQELDPATGAPNGVPVQMPGSTTLFNGQPNSSQQLMRTPIAARPGGGVYLAYSGGYPTTDKVLLWRLGAAKSAVVGTGKGDHIVSLAAAPDGRIWVFWIDRSTGRPLVFARRSNPGVTAFGPLLRAGAPSGQASAYRIAGDAQAGALDLLGLFGTASGQAQWHTQVLPGLELGAKPSKVTRSRTTTVEFTVRDPDPVKGVKVTVSGRSATTDAKGHASIDVGPTAKKSIAATAAKPGYTSGTYRLRVVR